MDAPIPLFSLNYYEQISFVHNQEFRYIYFGSHQTDTAQKQPREQLLPSFPRNVSSTQGA